MPPPPPPAPPLNALPAVPLPAVPLPAVFGAPDVPAPPLPPVAGRPVSEGAADGEQALNESPKMAAILQAKGRRNEGRRGIVKT
jgi:hypothetical protein